MARRWQFAKHKVFMRFIHLHAQEYQPSDLLFDSESAEWIFHDENWSRVKDRFEHRRLVAKGIIPDVIDDTHQLTHEMIVTEDGSMIFNGKATTNDEWFYLYLDPKKYEWSNYSWQFNIRRDTDFKELQFGIRYRDFYNRYRYRFENNRLYFDKVVRGEFLNGFNVVPFRMELGTWYAIRIDAYYNTFRLYVDGVLVSNDHDFDGYFPIGSIAIILWENDGKTDIKASLGAMSITEIQSG